MRRRSRAGGEPAKAQRRKTGARKSRITPKATHPRSSSAAGEETEVARLARERDEAFQRQAATADENARLLNELRESLQQKTAAADVLNLISRSTFDLPKVLNTLVESAARLCEADKGVILRPSGNDASYYAAASYHQTPRYAEYLKNLKFTPGRGSVVPRVLLEGKSVQIPDVLADPEYTSRELASVGDFRTVLGVPLLRDGVPTGVLVLHRAAVRPFTEKQIKLVETFADQGVIAIENTRLFEAEQQRSRELAESLEQQTATSEVLQVISRSAFDLEAVLNTLVESAARLCEADKGVILRPSREKASYHSAASYGHSPEYIEYMRTMTFEPGRGGVSSRVLLEGRSVQIADVFADPEWTYLEAARLGGYHTILGVPLLREGIPIGLVILQRAAVRPFTEKQIKLVETFADQAVIAIENTRLFEAEQQRSRELTESLEQQTATSEVLRVISSSQGDLQRVFESLLENATRLCGAKFGNLFLRTEDGFRYVALHGVPSEYVEWGKRQPRAVLAQHPHTPLTRMTQEKKVVHVPDLALDESYTEHDPRIVALVETAGARTLVIVPMLKDDELVGAIAIYRQEVRPFSDKQIALLSNFAAQAVIAIENTRLLNELRQRTTDLFKRTADLTEALEQQTATSEVLQVISSSPGDLTPVFAAMLEKAVRMCDATFGNIYRWQDGALHLVAAYNTPPALAEARRRLPLVPGQHPIIDRMVTTKTASHVIDAATTSEYIERTSPGVIEVVELGGVRTTLSVPMLRDNELIGSFTVYRQQVRPFTDKQIELVTNFAAQAVIAIENARLLNELRQRTDDLTEALERQTATSEVLEVISRSPGDLQPVFEAMLEKAVRLCGATFGNIYRWDGELLHLLAAHNTPPALVEARRQSGFRPSSVTRRMVETNTAVHVADLAADEAYTVEREQTVISGVELGGVRTLLVVPMLKENELIGSFSVYDRKSVPSTISRLRW
jgi:GAF domain-containing protein